MRWRSWRRDLRRKWPALRTQALPWLYAFLGNLTAAGMVFAVFEGVNVFRAWWWAVVSGTTTGYGDVLPHTIAGYLIAVYALLSSALLDRIFSAKLVAVMVEEPHLYSDAEQERDRAADELQLALLIRLSEGNGISPRNESTWQPYRTAQARVDAERRTNNTSPQENR